jgi:3D (Asp-Asp-Asp) domain-containing protein
MARRHKLAHRQQRTSRLLRRFHAVCLALAFASAASVTPAVAAAPEKDKVGDASSLIARAKNAVSGWKLQARLYHAGGGGAGARDSLGCSVAAYRTVAIDPTVVPKRSILFIKETVGMPLPNGRTHDGLWYASDTGGGIKGTKIDLFTGHGKGSMKPVMPLNLKRLTVSKAGTFKGCPPKLV